MKPTVQLVFLVRILLLGCAVLMAHWTEVQGAGLLALVLLSIAIAIGDGAGRLESARADKWALRAAWICSVAFWIAFYYGRGATRVLDQYHAILTWSVATALLLPNPGPAFRQANGRRRLGMSWAGMGAFIWLAASYLQNATGMFYFGLLIAVSTLIFCKRMFRMPAFAILVLNTCILLLIGLPLVDLLLHLRHVPRPEDEYYSYKVAKRHPVGFVRWSNLNDSEWQRMARAVMTVDHSKNPSWSLRPGSQGYYFQSHISINSLGFRGPEIQREKGAAYRIVAIGESTTYCYTLRAEDEPWPEVLEKMISQRLNPRRPVQVINAGVPGYDLENNLGRLEKDILPLRPDMIISYHGINGFHLIAPPPMQHYTGPARKERPISLLADCELRLKLMLWDHRRVHDPADFSLAVDEPMETAYARAYRQLVQCAQTNHFRLVVANFSMAVNSQSDPDLIRFYSHRFPTAAWDIRANEIHSSIVRQSALQHPDVIFVDTHPHLDGEHDKFIDLVHFTQAGRQQLAETFFAAIRTALKEDLDRATPDRQTKPTE